MTAYLIAWAYIASATCLLLGLAAVLTWPIRLRRENRRLQVQLAKTAESLRTWRHDCLDVMDENDRLRRDIARLSGHPAASPLDAHWDDIVQHTLDAEVRLSPVADVVPIQRRGGSS